MRGDVAGGPARVTRSPEEEPLLPVDGVTARLILFVFILCHSVLLVWNIDGIRSPWPPAAALLIAAAAGVTLCTVPGNRLPLRFTWGVVLMAPIVTALVVWQLPDTGWPGYASWNFGAVMWLLFVLSLRGRIALAWLAFALMTAVTALWCLDVARPLTDAVDLLIRQAGTLAISAVFGQALRTTGRRIAELHDVLRDQSTAVAAARVRQSVRLRNAERLQQLADPILARIADATPIDDRLRRDSALVEAELRDSVRARALYRHPLIDVARDARSRGLEVVLLDDSGPDGLAKSLAAPLARRVADELGGVRTGVVTVRVLPRGRNHVATILVDDGADRLIELDSGDLLAGGSAISPGTASVDAPS